MERRRDRVCSATPFARAAAPLLAAGLWLLSAAGCAAKGNAVHGSGGQGGGVGGSGVGSTGSRGPGSGGASSGHGGSGGSGGSGLVCDAAGTFCGDHGVAGGDPGTLYVCPAAGAHPASASACSSGCQANMPPPDACKTQGCSGNAICCPGAGLYCGGDQMAATPARSTAARATDFSPRRPSSAPTAAR